MIEVQALRYEVGRQVLLDEVSMKFEPGTITVILGPNGAGKSSLLKLLSGWLKPSKGEVRLNGRALHQYKLSELAKQRAFLEQDQVSSFALSVRQLIALGAAEFPGNNEVVEQLIRRADLSKLAEHNVQELSGGERQRAHLARVMAQIWPNKSSVLDFDGKWLLLDEWNSAMDLKHQKDWIKQFQLSRDHGLSIVMVLHDLVLAQALADHVVFLKGGKMIAHLPKAEAFNSALLAEVFQVEMMETPEGVVPKLI